MYEMSISIVIRYIIGHYEKVKFINGRQTIRAKIDIFFFTEEYRIGDLFLSLSLWCLIRIDSHTHFSHFRIFRIFHSENKNKIIQNDNNEETCTSRMATNREYWQSYSRKRLFIFGEKKMTKKTRISHRHRQFKNVKFVSSEWN